ncbi:TPA: type VII secretion protein EssB [Streptococcus equi subsp. zooepidemicus]|nr:type VII secretion protein EssB [Streptococcus equi subsp. zooepidemicus]HEL0604915.1 type VII secretion protein EssB [Streptococcus equi subsp. zooepidemicus]HEL1094054.1 type VII secretion protein EssB [Streptococcus equi subsp. zooepidemicus]HEL1212170.1 type VII secretion protein EssB [Streptococcus equi subsp. zooepidemicus]HEL1340417.1 type VII secretion protein EssB [Streptococcus equi subsp. zooepidemicus]
MEKKMKTIIRELLVEDVKGDAEVAYALLASEHSLFVPSKLEQAFDKLILEASIDDMYDWSALEAMIVEEKLRHLLNLSELFDQLSDSKFTYSFTPDNLVFNRNAEPQLIFRGIKDQVPPYQSIECEAFVRALKCMTIALLDKKTSYDALMGGKLPFYKGNLFCEAVAKAETLQELQELLATKYHEEQKDNKEHFSRVANKTISRLKLTTICSSVLALLSLVGVLYFLLFAMPYQEMVASLRMAFINQDYSKVITTAKHTDSKALSQGDKYIVAYSVIMTEPLTDKQKEELSKISNQSNEDYLRYWVLIGQARIDDAMDIASYLDDPQLLMYGLTKKIDDVQRDPNLTAEARTEQLNSYKSKLDELKKAYLTPKEEKAAGPGSDKE